MVELPGHPFIDPEQRLNDTVLAIDALLAPVSCWLNRRACGDDSDADDVLHGHALAVEAARQIARYVAEAVDEQKLPG
jgi:hypothetical protein